MMIRTSFPFALLAQVLVSVGALMGVILPLPALAFGPVANGPWREDDGRADSGAAGLPSLHQVRIEQRFSIRITPGAPVMPPQMLDEIEQGPPMERDIPRRADQCVAIANIAAVHGGVVQGGASPVGAAGAGAGVGGAASTGSAAGGGAGGSVPTGLTRGPQNNRLLLFMRDQHIVVAALEKACRPEDFYSGFYVARNGDGLLCTNRDTLQSRSGANCKVKAFRELSPRVWRRFP